MWDFVKSLFQSKKWVTAVAGIVSCAIARIGFDVDPAELTHPVALMMSYVVGQGIADHGKEREKIRARPAPGD